MIDGTKIKDLRIKNGMSQVELAEKVGISKQTLYKYENNVVVNIPSDKIELLATVLNTTPAYIMGWENNKSIMQGITDARLIKKLRQLDETDRADVEKYIDFLISRKEK